MTYWTHIVIEGYCMYDISRKKKIKVCAVEKLEDLLENKKLNWKVEDNPHYIKAKKPGWCKDKPMYQCLSKNCPFFAYTNAERKAYKKVDGLYE